MTLDATTEEGREIRDTVASDFRIENIFMKETEDEWHQEIKDYLEKLSPLQHEIIMMLANNYTKDEICEILHIEHAHYNNLLKKITDDKKIKPLRSLVGGR